jgi:hypothetical protein
MAVAFQQLCFRFELLLVDFIIDFKRYFYGLLLACQGSDFRCNYKSGSLSTSVGARIVPFYYCDQLIHFPSFLYIYPKERKEEEKEEKKKESKLMLILLFQTTIVYIQVFFKLLMSNVLHSSLNFA